MARVMWTRQALDDLKALHHFLARDAASYAELLVEALLDSAGQLLDQPETGQPLAEAIDDGVRTLAQGPWRLLYHVGEGEIQVLAVVAGCR